MGSAEVAAAMVILFAFAIGIVIGVVIVVSIASRHEDKRKSLWGPAPGPACQGVRWLVGAGVRGDWPFGESHGRVEDDSGQGQESER